MTILSFPAGLPDDAVRRGFSSRSISAKPKLNRFREIFEKVQLIDIADRPWDISDEDVVEEAFHYTHRNAYGRGNLNRITFDNFAQAFRLNKTGRSLVDEMVKNRPDVQEAFQKPITQKGFWRPEDAKQEDFGALSALVTGLVTPSYPRRISVKVAAACLDALRRPDSVNWAEIFFQAFQREVFQIKRDKVKNTSYLAAWLYNLWDFEGSLTKSEQEVYESAQISRIICTPKPPITAPVDKESRDPNGNTLQQNSARKTASSTKPLLGIQRVDTESSIFSVPTSQHSKNEPGSQELEQKSLNGNPSHPAGQAEYDSARTGLNAAKVELDDAKALTDQAIEAITSLAKSTVHEFSRIVSGQKSSHEKEVNKFVMEAGSAEEKAKKVANDLIWTRVRVFKLESIKKDYDGKILRLEGENRKLEKEVLHLKSLLPKKQEWREMSQKVTTLEEEAKRREAEVCACKNAETTMNARIQKLEKLCTRLRDQLHRATSEKISRWLSVNDYRELVGFLAKFPDHWEMRSEEKLTLDAYMVAYPLGPHATGQNIHHSELGKVIAKYKLRVQDMEQSVHDLLLEMKNHVQALEPWYTAAQMISNLEQENRRTSGVFDQSPSAETSRSPKRSPKRLRTGEKVNNPTAGKAN